MMSESFYSRVISYKNTTQYNESIHKEFEEELLSISWLQNHRFYCEQNNLGFGDRAFHFMWYLLLQSVCLEFKNPHILEIGVYKGQILSAWALIAQKLNLEMSITGISPLTGNSWWSKIKDFKFVDFIKDWQSGNFYSQEDYYAVIKQLFDKFDLDINSINLIKGFSNDEFVLNQVKNDKFHIIYIDGDHTYEGVLQDIKNYSPLIVENGFLIMDDASYFLPGKTYHKGHKSVSKACAIIPEMGFTNILNIGHNCVFQKNSYH